MANATIAAEGWALELARRGFLIFPLRPESKEPYGGESWVDLMTRDEAAIAGWFQHREHMNYGVCPGESRVVVDLDVKEAANGVVALEDLQTKQDMDDWVLGDTFTVSTPSGGVHLYLETDHPVSNAHTLPEGIDIRGRHGYVVGPGCHVDDGKVEGSYEVTQDARIKSAPAWIAEHLRRGRERSEEKLESLFDMDGDEAVKRGRQFIKRRDPAIEGLGGDKHTLITAMHLIDLGLSREMSIEIMTEPHEREGDVDGPVSWNDRCVPPWDIEGRKNTLEEKALNAWNYREREPGAKGGGDSSFEDDDLAGAMDVTDYGEKEYEGENRFKRLDDHLYSGGALFGRGKRREYVVPEWLLSHGMTAVLARRGGGKTVIMVDLALRIASDSEWLGMPVKEDFYSIYICGEDDDGAEEQVRAWCISNDVDEPPERFLFMDIITDLMSPEDTREWAEFLKTKIGPKGRAVVFLDTWQRASSRGGQNKDEDMQKAVHHAEALARSLDGPAVVAFHPPKASESMILGSSVIENSTTGIWSMTDHASGRKLEVTRMKGKGTGNYKILRFNEVKLGEQDEFGHDRTGVVPEAVGGTDAAGVPDEGHELGRKAFAEVMREIEVRRKDENPNSSKNYAATTVAKMISGYKDDPGMVDSEKEGDEWASEMLGILRESGAVNLASWQRVNSRILDLFSKDPRPYDFGDGYTIRLYNDGSSRRIKLDKSGMAA